MQLPRLQALLVACAAVAAYAGAAASPTLGQAGPGLRTNLETVAVFATQLLSDG